MVGPTASGKSELAEVVARRHRDLVPIAVDALSVYDGLEITTAMPNRRVIGELGYRCVAHVPIDQEYSLGQFLADLEPELVELASKGRAPLFVGGTALWVRAIVNGFRPPQGAHGLRSWLEARLIDEGDDRSAHQLLTQLDPLASKGIDSRNRRRLVRALEVALASGGTETVAGDRLGTDATPRYHQIGIQRSGAELERRIEARIEAQLAQGWVEEVEQVLARNPSRTARMAIGVAEISSYLVGACSFDEAIAIINRRTRRLAKRQLAWLRRDERIIWVSSIDEGVAVLDRLIDSPHAEGVAPLQTVSKAPTTAQATLQPARATHAKEEAQDLTGSAGAAMLSSEAPNDDRAALGEKKRVSRRRTNEGIRAGMELVKLSGAGNDFLIGDVPTGPMPDAETITALLNRSYGVGADGLILVDLDDRGLPIMHLFNQDGSRAEMSGNGLRCLGHYLVQCHAFGPSFNVATDAGKRSYQLVEQSDWAWTGETTMGDVAIVADEANSFLVNVGNPHRVIVMATLAELEAIDIAREGAYHQEMASTTGGINVEWIVRSEDGCVMRVYERGVGPTMACGTGSVASASVARHLGWIHDYAVVENPGGDLVVRFAAPRSVERPVDQRQLGVERLIGVDGLREQEGVESTDERAVSSASEQNRTVQGLAVGVMADREEVSPVRAYLGEQDHLGEQSGPRETANLGEEVWLRGPSLYVADISPARWLLNA